MLFFSQDTVIKCTKSGSEILIVNEKEGKEDTTILRLRNLEERDLWIKHLTEHVKDHER